MILKSDIVIVGAGFAGLTAARELTRSGRSVTVLEARNRVGGRTWTDTVDGVELEIGGQWISPDQFRIRELLDAFGIDTFPRYREGESVYINPEGHALRYSGTSFPTAKSTESEMARLTVLLDELASQMDPAAPWEHPIAHELDTESFQGWLERQSADGEATCNISLFVAAAMLTKPAHAFSVLQAVQMASSVGSFSNLIDENIVLDRRVTGGMQRVAQALADTLVGEIRLSSPVRRIRWKPGAVVVEADGGLEVEASAVVIAVSPNLYSTITFDPPLPDRQQQVFQHLSLGQVIKVNAVYETAFWRAEGLSGTGFGPRELVHEIYDNSPPDGSRGVIVGFISDTRADRALATPPASRRELVLKSLSHYLGADALQPDIYRESAWSAEEWTRGAYGASFDLGGMSRFGADLGIPIGPLHFACSDIAGAGYIHVEGAIASGQKAAAAIAELF